MKMHIYSIVRTVGLALLGFLLSGMIPEVAATQAVERALSQCDDGDKYGPSEAWNLTALRKWFERAADYSFAQLYLGMMYRDGRSVPEDDIVARQWLRRAAEQGNTQAQLYIAQMYQGGEGGRQDLIIAYAWAHAAGEQTLGDSMIRDEAARLRLDLREAILEGQSPSSLDDALALAEEYFKEYVLPFANYVPPATEDPEVERLVDELSTYGSWIDLDNPSDAEYVRTLYSRASVGANFRDLWDLGNLYWDAGDTETASEWFIRAAEQGHSDSQDFLGYAYLVGAGVPRDPVRARFWLQRAAEQGVAQSQYFLGGAYRDGEGGPSDIQLAYAWLNAAAEGCNPVWAAGDERDEVLETLRTDPAALLSAQRLAEQVYEDYVSPFR